MGVVTWRDNSLLTHDQWLLSRNNSIGASEVGAIVFGSRWTSNVEIFYNKISGKVNSSYNLRMYIGVKTEQMSAEMWEYYDGVNKSSIPENERRGIKVKQCINLNSTAFNSDFPFLSATPDRTILPFGIHADKKGNGALEIKNTNSYVLKSYDGELPVENVIQLVTQLMCCGYDYGELFYFLDNSDVDCTLVTKKNTRKAQDVILLHTSKFWKNVQLGKPLYTQMYEAKRNYNFKLANEIERELISLEPPIQNTAAYLDYVTNRYKDRQAKVGLIQGTEEQFLIAKKHREIANKIKKLEEEKQLKEIELRSIIKDANCLDFGKHGMVTLYQNKNDRRTFLNKIK